ncbi:hypothetical protein CMO92_01240 [Candidatus Woesearchaeota archaeon]|nr:hypothetical protein [Candidatus Woesearchaeota archaeon]|tara:strand:+ start:245 stop:2110 length:1866 start_codon:yes stop_codon:yes gene_type:complete
MKGKGYLTVLGIVVVFFSLFLVAAQSLPTGEVTGTLGFCLNTPPAINNSCNVTAPQNQSYSCQVNYSDAEGDSVNFSGTNITSTDLFNISSGGWINFTPLDAVVGNHSYNVTINDSSGCESDAYEVFNLTVSNSNDAPLLVTDLPNVEFVGGTSHSAFFLNDYFTDPDGDNLSYTTSFTAFGITITDNSEVIVTSSSCFTNVVTFTATDPYDFSAESNAISITSVSCVRASQPPAAAAGSSSGGGLALCDPQWECYDYQDCLRNSTQRKFCVELVGCYTDLYEDWVWRNCTYINCTDGIQQEREEGVDCGGVCDDCPSCSDGVLNQGEEKVDCGGPCGLCDTCTNNVKDGFELGVDCGGLCEPCPTCTDNILNQDEEDVDCGGSCPPCSELEMPALLPAARTFTIFLLISIIIVFCMYVAYKFFHKQIRTFFGNMVFAVVPQGPRFILIKDLEERDRLITLLSKPTKRVVEEVILSFGAVFLPKSVSFEDMLESLQVFTMPTQIKKVLSDLVENIQNLSEDADIDLVVEELKMLIYLTSPSSMLLEKHVSEKRLSKGHFLRFQQELHNFYRALMFSEFDIAKRKYESLLSEYQEMSGKEQKTVHDKLDRVFFELSFFWAHH